MARPPRFFRACAQVHGTSVTAITRRDKALTGKAEPGSSVFIGCCQTWMLSSGLSSLLYNSFEPNYQADTDGSRFCNLLQCLSDRRHLVARFNQRKSRLMKRDMELRQRIWNLLGPERRQAAAEAFWSNPELRAAQQQAEALLARKLKARPVFVKRLPLERKALYLAREMAATAYLWDAALSAYHFAGHRSMLTDFLNGVGIAHENGHYETVGSAEPPSIETLQKTIGQLLEKYRKLDVFIYLGALVLQDPRFWAQLRSIVERMEKEVEAET